MILTIAFPSKGICDPAFASALRLLEIPADQYSVLYVEGADVAYARNLLAEKAKDVADYIMFLDDDVLPPMNTITKLLSHQKDVVSGLYFAKQEPYFPQIYLKNKEVAERYDCVEGYQKDSLIEIDSCGGGCLLIKAEVFKKLKRPYFQYVPKGENNPRKGEDFYFCEKAKEAGYKIFCDTSIICKHIGKKYVGPELWEYSKEMLKGMKEKMGDKKYYEWRKSHYDN
jgi:GT2 family glycosyltransferase